MYNAGSTLGNALESILHQPFLDYEIVVVDGGSTDDTLATIRHHSQSRENFKYVSEADKGAYDAMNKGMNIATGNWLLFLGADDQIRSNHTLSSMSSYLSQGSSKIVYGNVEVVRNTAWACDGDIYAGKFDLNKLLKTNICHQSIFYNSDFVKNEIGKYNLDYKLCADWDFNLRCFSKTEFLYVDEVIAKFYGGGMSTLSNEDTPFFNDFVENVAEYFKLSYFDEILNSPDFSRFEDVLVHQKKQNYLRYMLNRVRIKFLKTVHGQN